MRRLLPFVAGAVVTVVLLVAVSVAYIMSTGLTALPEPGAVEAELADAALRLAFTREVTERPNPVPPSAEAIAEGMSHFADHCAVCHANDGSGDTEMGRNLYPKAPDMRQGDTQDLTDGQLFWIIENGIRFTGMPGWGTGTPESEEQSWHLVHFIRHLPNLTEAEVERMEALNPRSSEESRQEIEEERFLQGLDAQPAEPSEGHQH